MNLNGLLFWSKFYSTGFYEFLEKKLLEKKLIDYDFGNALISSIYDLFQPKKTDGGQFFFNNKKRFFTRIRLRFDQGHCRLQGLWWSDKRKTIYGSAKTFHCSDGNWDKICSDLLFLQGYLLPSSARLVYILPNVTYLKIIYQHRFVFTIILTCTAMKGQGKTIVWDPRRQP